MHRILSSIEARFLILIRRILLPIIVPTIPRVNGEGGGGEGGGEDGGGSEGGGGDGGGGLTRVRVNDTTSSTGNNEEKHATFAFGRA